MRFFKKDVLLQKRETLSVPMRTIISASIGAAFVAASIYHVRLVHHAIHPVPVKQVSSSSRVSKSLVRSAAAKIINPHGHVPIYDTRYIIVPTSRDLSDEEILSRFVKGFFGGHVFGLERGILRVTGKELTRFEAQRNEPVVLNIWSTDEISAHKLAPVGAILFGVFRIADIHLEHQATHQTPSQNSSYVDFVFGSDVGFIAGVHRFSISREDMSKAPEEQNVGKINRKIEFAHLGCNPKEDKPLKPDFLQTLHLWYAMLLFREGVAEVMKA